MGIFASFTHGLPLLSVSDFEPYHSLSEEKRRTLRCYALQLSGGKGFSDDGSPSPERTVRNELARRGHDPDDMLALRSYIIRNGLMRRNA